MYIPLAAARLFHLPLATRQRGKADVQSGLPAGVASLRETGSVDRYTPRGPVSQLAAAKYIHCIVYETNGRSRGEMLSNRQTQLPYIET